MTTKITIEVQCASNKEVEVSLSGVVIPKTNILQNGEATIQYVYGNREVTVREVLKQEIPIQEVPVQMVVELSEGEKDSIIVKQDSIIVKQQQSLDQLEASWLKKIQAIVKDLRLRLPENNQKKSDLLTDPGPYTLGRYVSDADELLDEHNKTAEEPADPEGYDLIRGEKHTGRKKPSGLK